MLASKVSLYDTAELTITHHRKIGQGDQELFNDGMLSSVRMDEF